MQVSKEVGGVRCAQRCLPVSLAPELSLCLMHASEPSTPGGNSSNTRSSNSPSEGAPTIPLRQTASGQPGHRPTEEATSSQELLSNLRGFSRGFLSQERSLVPHPKTHIITFSDLLCGVEMTTQT